MPKFLRMSRLKTAVLLPFVGFVLTLAAALGVVEYNKFRQEGGRLSGELSAAMISSFQAAVDAESEALRGIALTAANDQGLKAAFLGRDRETLLARTVDLYRTLNDSDRLTHFYFVDAARTCFLRVHQPDRHGDIIARHTMLSAEATRKPAAGIELGPMGTLTLRVVVPWFDQGRLLGYIETGKEIDHLFGGLRRQFGVQPMVFLPKARLNRADWEDGMAMMGRAAKWDQFPNVVAALGSGVPEGIMARFLVSNTDTMEVGGRWYGWTHIHVPDASGENAASIGVVRDITVSHGEMVRLGLVIGLVVVVGSLAVIAIFWVVIDRVEQDLARARDKLASREAMYHSLFSDAQIAMLLISPEEGGAIVDANRAACAYYGYDIRQIRALRISDINVLSVAEIEDEMARANAQDRSHFFFRHRLANGEIRDVEVHSGPIMVKDRTLLYSIIHDVTDRRRLEEERRRLVMAIEQSPVSVVITDTDARIEYVNAAFTRTSGYDLEEVIGQNPRLLQSGEPGGVNYVDMWAELSTGTPWSGLFHNKRKNGDHYWEQAHIFPVFGDQGRITHYVGIKEDITERKRSEERLKESEERFRSLIEGTTDWVWETDENHCFTWFSASFETVVRIPITRILGKRRWDLASESHEIDPTRWQAHIADLTALRSFRDFRYWISLPDGSAKWISISGAPRFSDKGEFLGYRGSGSDVTDFADISLRLRTMVKVVEQSPVSVIITDTEGDITYVNPHFTAVTGYAPEDVIGRNPRMFASGLTPLSAYGELWSTVSGGGTWTGEFHNRRKDGTLYWEQAIIFPVTNEEGRLVHYVSIKEDVSDRKHAETRLREQMQLTQHHYESLRALGEISSGRSLDRAQQLANALSLGCRHLNLPIGIISRIEGDTYRIAHHHAPEDSGLADGQDFALGQTYCAMTMQSGDVLAIPFMGKSIHSGHPCYAAFGLEAYIGTPVTVRGERFGTVNFSSPNPYMREFDDGDMEFMRLLARWVGAVIERDMSECEIREALGAAEAARRRTDLLLSSAGEGIFGIDVQARVTFINPAALLMLGYEDETLVIGRNAHDVTGHRLADGQSCHGNDCAIRETLRDGVERRRDSDMFGGPQGGAFPVEFSVTAMVGDGGVGGAVVVFHDISERRAAERSLAEAFRHIERQAGELARINAELEQFAYVASHDLRQPLRMISSYLTLIDQSVGGTFSDDVRKFFEFATDGAKRMDRLILGLLEYSRTGRNARPLERLPLGEPVAESLANLTVAVAESGSQIQVAEDLPEIMGDRSDLSRLFQNLIGNAIKYRSPDREPHITVGWRGEAEEIVVWVRDNGTGIAAEQHDRAFLIFQRLVPASSVEGSGLGLAICKKIVTNHHGRIWIESEPGQGTTFLMAFPRPEMAETKDEAICEAGQ